MPFPLTLYIFNALRTLAKRILLLRSKWVTKNPTLAVQMDSYEGNGHLLSKAHLNLLDTSPKLPSGPFQITKACSWVIFPIYGSNYWIRCFLFNLIFLLHPFQFPSFRLNAINAKGRDKLSYSTIWFKDWKFEPTSLFWFFFFFWSIAKPNLLLRENKGCSP